MLDMRKTQDGSTLTITLIGRMDAMTSPQFESEFAESVKGITKLYLDMRDVDYVSSAGLRAILYAQNIMDEQGSMVLLNVREEVKEIFLVTGFLDILTLE